MDRSIDEPDHASKGTPPSPRSNVTEETGESEIYDQDKFMITKLLNSETKDWNGILQEIDKLYEEYLQDPESLQPEEIPENALMIMVPKLKENQKNINQEWINSMN